MGEGFGNPVVGGSSTLIRPAIKSPNYVAGVSGWSINRDGTAEFNNLTARGTVIVGSASGPHIFMSTTIPTPLVNYSTDFVWSAAEVMYVSAVDFQFRAVGTFVGVGGPLEIYADGTYNNSTGHVNLNTIVQDLGGVSAVQSYLYGSLTYNPNAIQWSYRNGTLILASSCNFQAGGQVDITGAVTNFSGTDTTFTQNVHVTPQFFDAGLWTAYTPTWAGSVTNPTLGAGGFINGFWRYENSREVHVIWLAIMGAGATKGSGTYTLTLPVNTGDLHGFGATGQWHFNDSGSALRDGSVIFDNSLSKLSFSVPAAGAFLGSATLTGTFATSLFQGSIKYIV